MASTPVVGQPMRGAAVLAMAASAAVVVGAFGPWISLGLLHRSGVDGSDDAYIQIGVGVVCAIAAWASRYGERKYSGWLFIGGLVAGGVAAYDISQVSKRSARVFGETLSPDPGWGLIMCAIGGGVIFLCSLILARAPQNDVRPAQGGAQWSNGAGETPSPASIRDEADD